MKNLLLAAVLTAAVPNHAAAATTDTCGSIASIVSAPYRAVRDQTGTNWCNSYVASDLLTQALGGRRVSAFHVAAIGYAQDFERREGERRSDPERSVWPDSRWVQQYMDVDILFRGMAGRELCTEAAFPSNDGSVMVRAAPALQLTLSCLRGQPGTPARPLEDCIAAHLDLRLITPSLEDARAVLGDPATATQSLPRVADRLMTARCRRGEGGLVRVPTLSVRNVIGTKRQVPTSEQTDRITAALDEGLAARRLVGVAIVPEWLNQPAQRETKHGGSHIVTALGRYRHSASGQCYYLLRNTWGANGCGQEIKPGPGIDCAAAPGMFGISGLRLRPGIDGVDSLAP